MRRWESETRRDTIRGKRKAMKKGKERLRVTVGYGVTKSVAISCNESQ